MMVPRAFAHNPLAQRQFSRYDEKEDLSRRALSNRDWRSLRQSDASRSPSRATSSRAAGGVRSEPVKIPPARLENPTLVLPSRPTRPAANLRPSMGQPDFPQRRESARDILTATAIPIRKRPRPRPAQRLPDCDYVADFSKLLLDDVKPTSDGSLSGSLGNPHFDGLFGNIDGLVEGQMFVGSEGLYGGILSTRSLSAESTPSLTSVDDFSLHDNVSVSASTIRSVPERKLRHVASSEDCAAHHPLLPDDDERGSNSSFPPSARALSLSPPELVISPPTRPRRRPMAPEKRASTFKSSLTASLKALKSAAQTVSNIATTPMPSPRRPIQPDDFLTRSFFDIQPSLTDDRRPPPSDQPPSAALRRYLNPHNCFPPDSPAQLHFWLEDKPTRPLITAKEDNKPKLKIKKKYQTSPLSKDKNEPRPLPALVPLATCIPSSIRTANASSPPIWLAPDGTPTSKYHPLENDANVAEGEGQPRQREPRENRDFLRVLVCEMNMRRSGKLAEESEGRAKLWLPPVQEAGTKDVNGPCRGERKTGAERWTSLSVDDL